MNTHKLWFATLLLIVLSTASQAGEGLGIFGGLGCSHDKCCEVTCCPTIEEVEVKKHCYEVECEEICVPKVQFPWHLLSLLRHHRGCKDDCAPRGCSGTQCGKVKTIRVLKKEEYKCTECKCIWDLNHGKGGAKGK